MQETIAKESRRRRMARRIGAAGIALAAVLMLPACHQAYGGGYIAAPVDGSPLFNGDANFGFNFTCDAGVKGQITYHDSSTMGLFPGLKIQGTVDTILLGDPTTEDVVAATSCEEVIEAQAAHFEGSYRSQNTTFPGRGRFNVLVFDQGEPSKSVGIFDGDGFSIELSGVDAPYTGYTRAGNIKGGNIQVDN
jgi:hypothetical protein